jgi:5-formyltetrahydrofolate cyclo-ligase
VAADEKAYLRSVLRACREGLPAACVDRVSRIVQERLRRTACYDRAATLVLYAAKDNEIHTDGLCADALATGRRVLFPRVARATQELLLVRVLDPAELAPGAFGVLEPTGAEIVPLASLGQALICVPGLAFTPGGHRLGRGGGYYDRLLAAAGAQSPSAGLAYSFQVLDRLPQSLGDQRLNLILTESAAYGTAPLMGAPALRADQGGVPRC